MDKVPFLDVGAGYRELKAEIDGAVARVLGSGSFILGDELRAFEEEFAARAGAKHAVGVANGLDALSLALQAMGVGPGDEVLVPGMTFIATWLAVSRAGATPVPVEPDPATFSVDAARLRAKVGPRTKAAIPVHLYGRPALVGDVGVPVLYDAAQAHGAPSPGTSAWSFYPTKNLGAFGDGGAVTTDDAALAERLRMLRNYGSTEKYVHRIQGTNSRLDPLQAAILRVKLRHLDAWNERRRRIADRYGAALKGLPGLTLPAPCDGHVWYAYVVRHPKRDRLREELAKRGVETLIHYPTAPHLQEAYAPMGLKAGSLPVTERLHAEVLSLPIGPHLTDEQAGRVAGAVGDACGQL